MLIMPSTDVNFQVLAENITNDFFTNGTALADGVVKVAKEHSFTPEEVTRLVEKTNTAASLHLLKTATDKKATFTLAQPELVLRQTHPANEPREKAASYKGIPFTRKTRQSPPLLKAAASNESETPDIKPMQALFVVRKALDERKRQKVASELKVQDRVDYLASEFNVWNGPDFGKFANDCMLLFGSKARPVLTGLAKYLQAPLAKTAEDVDFIDDRTDHVQAMREICSGLEDIVKLAGEISDLENVHDTILKAMNKANRDG